MFFYRPQYFAANAKIIGLENILCYPYNIKDGVRKLFGGILRSWAAVFYEKFHHHERDK
ncbi:MAG: hypothetical protein ACR2PV_06505 [Gammaproteobacteria bacterium]